MIGFRRVGLQAVNFAARDLTWEKARLIKSAVRVPKEKDVSVRAEKHLLTPCLRNRHFFHAGLRGISQ